ncbi:polyadenylation/uridylation factor 1, partial [Trypanosoma grayi]|uniref:polyadenylation/uridylation factor 1 n=1 Tax=Trypanosoma grayi TaxID=71804 RepID=UPI0004F442DE
MFQRRQLLFRRVALGLTGARLNRATTFQPFSQKDEDDLVRVVKTKPRHVLKHVRQQVWRSRKRELHFRNTVTHLMIVLQEFLRKQLIDPASASQIMEGIMEECVKYAQHDMAHLLFRALLRFRKYGCTISIDALRHLFESYKENDSSELMLQLANEMRGDPALRPLCVAAYLFAGHPDEAEALQEG